MTQMQTPTQITKLAHEKARCDTTFDWENKQDFEFASRGLIHRPDDAAVYDALGNIVWHHEAFEEFLHGDAPLTVHPSLWRHALLNNFRGLFKVTDGIYQVRGESLANVTFVESDNGYIVIDPLTTAEVAEYALNLLFQHVGKKPIVAMIYSHTHSDHFGGVRGMISQEEVESGQVRVFASEGFVEWVLKEHGLAAEGTPSRNAYMYGENLPVSAVGLVDDGLGQAIEGGQVTYIAPTDVIGRDGATLSIDGIEIEFMYAPGEAPTGMHCYFPKFNTLHIADNCYMCMHNVYTIRGAFPRDALQWADSVAQSLRFTETEYLVSGHNWPVFGRDEVKRFLGQQRDGIKFMHDQTLRLMNFGYVPAEIANQIEFPPSLARLWHLRGYYGTLKHNVRGIYTYYLGWYDGNPATLDELPPRILANKTLEYMGGVNAVIARAREDYEQGNYRWVVHILNQVLWAEPENSLARELASAAHTQLGYSAENATWRNAYLSAAIELTQGLPETPKLHRVLRDVTRSMSVLHMLDALSIRLNASRAIDKTFVINWILTDSSELSHSELSNCVLNHRQGNAIEADATITLTRSVIGQMSLEPLTIDQFTALVEVIEGDVNAVTELLRLLDHFPHWFPVATHGCKFEERSYSDLK